MKMSKALTAMLLASVFSMTLAGCENDGPVEEAGGEVDDAVEETGDAVDDATDD